MDTKVPFDKLELVTRTVMIYTNFKMDIQKLFRELYVSDTKKVNIYYTKKLKVPDMKLTRAPYGEIFSLRNALTLETRGVSTNPFRTELHILREKEAKNIITLEEMERLKKININQKSLDFRNQLCAYMSLTQKDDKDILNINIMIFTNCFKIVGCKNDSQLKIILEKLSPQIYYIGDLEPEKVVDQYTKKLIIDYESKVKKGIFSKNYRISGFDKDLKIIPFYEKFIDIEKGNIYLIDKVMINLKFKMGNYKLDRRRVNLLLNRPEYKDVIEMSVFNIANSTSVKVKILVEKPTDFEYKCKVGKTLKEISIKENRYKLGKQTKKKKRVTFLIFESSTVIISGKYLSCMEKYYNYIYNILLNNREYVELKC